MLEEKKLREAERRVKQYLNDEIIRTKGKPEHVEFFRTNKRKEVKFILYIPQEIWNKVKIPHATTN